MDSRLLLDRHLLPGAAQDLRVAGGEHVAIVEQRFAQEFDPPTGQAGGNDGRAAFAFGVDDHGLGHAAEGARRQQVPIRALKDGMAAVPVEALPGAPERLQGLRGTDDGNAQHASAG